MIQIDYNKMYKILRIIFIIVLLSSMLKTCAKAVSSPPQTIVNEINENIEKVANYYGIDHYPIYTTSTIQKASSNFYCIFITDSTSPWMPNYIGAFFPQYDTLTTTYNGSQFLNNISTTLYSTTSNTVSGLSDWAVNKNAIFKYMYTQFNWDTKTLHSYSAGNEYGAEIILRPPITYYLGHMHTQPITYSGEQLEAGTLNYNYRSTFIENVVCEDTIITSMHATLDNIELECNDLGTYWNLVCPNSTLLNTKQIYTLNVESVIDGEIETLTERIIFFPPGTLIENGVIIRTPSGDYIFSTENATNQIIESQDNFFTDLTEMLFTMNSGDIEYLTWRVQNAFDLSGEQQVEETILNIANQHTEDFKISWQAFHPTWTIKDQFVIYDGNLIPSGEVNFSQIERENETLHVTMNWTRIILGFSIVTLLIREYMKIWYDVIGGSPLLADHDKDSNRIVDKGDKN